VSDIVSALRSFKPGSAAGPDGLRQQHIQDIMQESGTLLISSLVNFVNHVLSRGVPEPVRNVFFGANLHALRKKSGGLRPIAVCLTLRRLTSKVENRWGSARMSPLLAQRQLGWGYLAVHATGSMLHGLSMVHATRAFLLSSTPWEALVNAGLHQCIQYSSARFHAGVGSTGPPGVI